MFFYLFLILNLPCPVQLICLEPAWKHQKAVERSKSKDAFKILPISIAKIGLPFKFCNMNPTALVLSRLEFKWLVITLATTRNSHAIVQFSSLFWNSRKWKFILYPTFVSIPLLIDKMFWRTLSRIPCVDHISQYIALHQKIKKS